VITVFSLIYFIIWLHVKVVYFLLFSGHILYLDLCVCVCVWEREREMKLQSTNLTKLNFILPCNGKVSIYLPEIGDFKWELKNPLRSPVHSNIASGFSWIFFLWIEESIQRPSLIMLLLLSKLLFSMNYIYLTACLVEIRMVLCGLNILLWQWLANNSFLCFEIFEEQMHFFLVPCWFYFTTIPWIRHPLYAL